MDLQQKKSLVGGGDIFKNGTFQCKMEPANEGSKCNLCAWQPDRRYVENKFTWSYTHISYNFTEHYP
jgi:hypothetical protein